MVQDYLGSHVVEAALASLSTALSADPQSARVRLDPEAAARAAAMLADVLSLLQGHWFELARHRAGTHVARALLKVFAANPVAFGQQAELAAREILRAAAETGVARMATDEHASPLLQVRFG